MDILQELARALGPEMERQKAIQYGIGYKHDITGGANPISYGYNHGPGGLLTFPGVDPNVFSNVMAPTSILGQLPTAPSVFTDPTYWTITGVQADSGSEPDGVCDDAPVGGFMKGCLTRSVFGRYERQTAQLELNRLGQRINRGDPVDLRLVNSPLAPAGLFGNLGVDGTSPRDVLTNEISRKFWERNISFYRLLARQLWLGNPTNNTGAGGYKEMTGLQLLVNTGYEDVETGVACSSMDSYVANFGYGRIDASGSQIVAAMTNIAHQLTVKADAAGASPVRWVVAMRPEVFYELTSIWPCSYLTFRCATAPGVTAPVSVNIDSADAIRVRDEMRAGKYLLIDGNRWDVVLDSAIPELDGTETGGNFPRGCFSSDIYFLPMSVVGGTSVLYLEYFDYSNESLSAALQPQNMILARAEGAFLTWPKQTNNCVQWQSKIEPRLVLRTPWLAARLRNVVYCPIEHTVEPFPDDPYFKDGGRTNRVAQGSSFTDLWE